MATLKGVPDRAKWRHIVKLENPAKNPNGSGGQDENFQGWVACRGYFQRKRGYRNFESGFDQMVQEYECFLPWRSEFDNNMTKDTRLVYNNRIFKIESTERIEENRHIIKLNLTEVS